MRDARGHERVYCQELGANEPYRVRGAVVECTGYDPVNSMSQWEAEKIAWVLEVRKGTPGFRPPATKAE